MLPKLDDNVIIVVVLTWWLFFIALEIRSNCHGLYKYVTNNDPTHKVLTQLLFRQNSFVLLCKAGLGPKSTYSTELLLENNHCKCNYFQDSTAKNALFPKQRSNPIIRKKNEEHSRMIWWVITSNRKHNLCHCILFHFKHNGKMQYKSKDKADRET